MTKKYAKWTEELFEHAILKSMEMLKTTYMPTHTDLMTLEPFEVDGQIITGASLSNRVNYMGGFIDVSEDMGLIRKITDR